MVRLVFGLAALPLVYAVLAQADASKAVVALTLGGAFVLSCILALAQDA